MPESDVIIVGLKSVKNHDVLPELLRPVVTDNTVVILIQNGIGLEEDLQQVFPRLKIIAGLAFICSAKVGPGHISHQCYGSINLGNYSCPDNRFQEIIKDLQDAGLQVGEVPYSPSMKLDYDFHRPMEIEYLYTRPIAEARRKGFDKPKLAMLEAELRFIQEHNNI